MFKIRRLKFGRSTIFLYLCTGFENEAERYSSSRTDGVCIPGKGMMMMAGCFMLAISGNTTIGGCKSRARNKLHGSAGEIGLATVRPLILGDAKIRNFYEVAKFGTIIRKNRK